MMISISSSTPTGAIPYTPNSSNSSSVKASPAQNTTQAKANNSPNWGKILLGGIVALGGIIGLVWGGKTFLHLLEENKQLKQELASASPAVADEFKPPAPVIDTSNHLPETLHQFKIKNMWSRAFGKSKKMPRLGNVSPELEEVGIRYNGRKGIYHRNNKALNPLAEKVHQAIFYDVKSGERKLKEVLEDYDSTTQAIKKRGNYLEVHDGALNGYGVSSLVRTDLNPEEVTLAQVKQLVKDGHYHLPKGFTDLNAIPAGSTFSIGSYPSKVYKGDSIPQSLPGTLELN